MKNNANLWLKLSLASIMVVEVIMCIYFGNIIYQKKQAGVLGSSVSIISKSKNSPSSISNLKYYYEPERSMKETDLTPWLKTKVTWTYNNDTLNDQFDYTLKKSTKTFRIIALGDSYTFGDHVNTADSWPEKLEEFLNTAKPCINYDMYEVINLGVRGFDIQDEVERYRIRGTKYNPDLVVWMLINNDFDEINELFNPLIESKKQLFPEEFSKKNNIVSIVETQAFKDAKIQFLTQYDEKKRFEIFNQQVRVFNAMYSGVTVLTTFPFLDDSYKELMKLWTQNRNNIYYFDELPNIFTDASLRVLDGHPSELGHRIIARDIYQYLINVQGICKND